MVEPAPKLRWYRPTPDRLILALLAVECLLWLSERFQWFGFSHHKGWTVLIAVVAVVATLLLMLLWFLAGVLFRWRFQFGIRSLLILTVAVALPFSWLAVEMKQAREQKVAVAAIMKMGGWVFYDFEHDALNGLNGDPNPRPPGPDWLRSLLGDDFFAQADGVLFTANQVCDADLEDLRELTQLRGLGLYETGVTDAGLENLTGLSQLQQLVLIETKVTDAGIEKLQQALPNCKIYH